MVLRSSAMRLAVLMRSRDFLELAIRFAQAQFHESEQARYLAGNLLMMDRDDRGHNVAVR
jgi:hypothetical protein